jgi:ATP-dependent Clp protease ATP-binding subunit ClpA
LGYALSALWAENLNDKIAFPSRAHLVTSHQVDPKTQTGSISNFTPRAQCVLALARKEAERSNHTFIGTEHLLRGLLQLGQGTAFNVLTNRGVNLDALRAEIERQLGPAVLPPKMVGDRPYTPRFRKVLALAAQESMEMNHDYVGTEHLLLGLLREGNGVAARVLKEFNVELETTREEVIKQPVHNDAVFSEILTKEQAKAPVDRSELLGDLFTPRVRRTFTLAVEEAESRKEPFVETEHVLIGLVRMGQGVAASVLIKIGVNAETVAARFGSSPESKPIDKTTESPCFGPLVKEVLSFAAEEARELEHTYVGTEHILLALLRQPHGGAARIFKELCVDAEALRKQVMIAFDVKTSPAKSGETRDPAIEQFGSKHTETFTKKALGAESAVAPDLAKAPREPLNLSLRYDVYCVQRDGKAVVHRNVQFKSVKKLTDDDPSTDFVELEQPDGKNFFIAKSSIARFCPAGVNPEIENL